MDSPTYWIHSFVFRSFSKKIFNSLNNPLSRKPTTLLYPFSALSSRHRLSLILVCVWLLEKKRNWAQKRCMMHDDCWIWDDFSWSFAIKIYMRVSLLSLKWVEKKIFNNSITKLNFYVFRWSIDCLFFTKQIIFNEISFEIFR